MQSYNALIYQSIPGGTPEEKFNSLQKMKELLAMVAYPRRGVDDYLEIEDVAYAIQDVFSLEDLSAD